MGPKMVVSLQYTFYFGFKVITHGAREVVLVADNFQADASETERQLEVHTDVNLM